MNGTPNLPPIIASRYIPVRLIGKGGMGAVYEVEHARTGERLALKVLLAGVGSSGEAVERFKREARASARIKSQHVARVTDADVAPELDGAPFLVMELLDGMDLERAAATSLPAPEIAVSWLRQVAQAIDKAHHLGIIHRDLKPENLFLAAVEGGRSIVKVLDFGIAKMSEDGSGMTESGQMLGTPKYMAPEQASPNASITPAADRCALGLIAFRLLVGESYYQGGALGILGQLLHAELRPPSTCGSRFGGAFDAWFLKACHRDPGQRFTSASEQIETLATALGLPSVGSDVTLPSPAFSPLGPATVPAGDHTPSSESAPSRRRVAARLSIAVALAVVLFAGLMVNRRHGMSSAGAMPTASVPTPAAFPPSQPPAPAAPPPQPTLPPPTSEAPVAESRSAPQRPARGAERARGLRRDEGATLIGATGLAGEKAKTDVDDPYAEQK